MANALLSEPGQIDIRRINSARFAAANPNRDGLLTEYAKPGAPKEDPSASMVFRDVENRDYLCKACGTVCHSMKEFNEHCGIDPRGTGREMKCEYDRRMKSDESGDPAVVALAQAKATAEILAPALNAIGEALLTITTLLSGKTSLGEINGHKSTRKENAGSPASLPRKARPRRSASLRGMGQPEGPVVDPPKEPETPRTA